MTNLRFIFLVLLALVTALPAQDEPRSALVVGVANYRDMYFKPLSAPVEDAKAIAAKLETLGFRGNVTLLLNPTRREMIDAVDSFGTTLTKRGGVGLFYFSGHGAMKSDEEGVNFLIPAGTSIRTENDLPEEAFNTQRVANRMKEAGNRLNLVFLDACRSHGLPKADGQKASGGGLAAMRGASGLMFFFATQPGAVAWEDSVAGRGLFTSALLQHMGTPGTSFMDMMADVTADTERLSLRHNPANPRPPLKQSPFIAGTISGRFAFASGLSGIPAPQSAPVDHPIPPPATALDKTAQVVVLCYHGIEKAGGSALSITPELFEQHMQRLRDNGIHVIAMRDFLAWRRNEKTIPAKSAIITIDDGYVSAFDVARPILKKFGYPWTCFIYTKFVASGDKSISWEQLATLRDEGVEMGCHTVSHFNLGETRGKSPEAYEAWLREEILGSKQLIENKLATKCSV